MARRSTLVLSLVLASFGCSPEEPKTSPGKDPPSALSATPERPRSAGPYAPPPASPNTRSRAELDAALERTPLDIELRRARVQHDLERGDYDGAHRALNVGLYTLAQADALPSVDTWLPLLAAHYDRDERAVEGSRLLVMLRRFYIGSAEVDLGLVEYLRAEGRDGDIRLVLEEGVEKFPDDPRWAEELAALR